jgi:hypothetical protein
MPRRGFNNGTNLWSISGSGIVTDNAVTGWDGTNEASTLVLTSTPNQPWQVQYGDTTTILPAGTYTLGINVKSNSGSPETFRFLTPNGLSTQQTATTSWQRLNWTVTTTAPFAMNNFTICADFTTSIGADPKNASLQIMDFDLYPSATDLVLCCQTVIYISDIVW